VYLRDDGQRDEYVLNEEGLMWRGSHNRQKEVMWKYGQFQKNMLEASFLLLLKIRRLALIYCNDPVHVSRNLSAAVSCTHSRKCFSRDVRNHVIEKKNRAIFQNYRRYRVISTSVNAISIHFKYTFGRCRMFQRVPYTLYIYISSRCFFIQTLGIRQIESKTSLSPNTSLI